MEDGRPGELHVVLLVPGTERLVLPGTERLVGAERAVPLGDDRPEASGDLAPGEARPGDAPRLPERRTGVEDGACVEAGEALRSLPGVPVTAGLRGGLPLGEADARGDDACIPLTFLCSRAQWPLAEVPVGSAPAELGVPGEAVPFGLLPRLPPGLPMRGLVVTGCGGGGIGGRSTRSGDGTMGSRSGR